MVRRKKSDGDIDNTGTENKEKGGMGEVLELLKGMDRRIKDLETKPILETKPAEVRQSHSREAYQAKGFVPRDFRQIVDDLLGPEYGLEVQDFTDSMDFQIMVIVPDDIALKAKALTPDNIALGMRDTRTKVVPRALGVNGVRDWVTKVRENLAKAFAQNGVASPLN